MVWIAGMTLESKFKVKMYYYAVINVRRNVFDGPALSPSSSPYFQSMTVDMFLKEHASARMPCLLRKYRVGRKWCLCAGLGYYIIRHITCLQLLYIHVVWPFNKNINEHVHFIPRKHMSDIKKRLSFIHASIIQSIT